MKLVVKIGGALLGPLDRDRLLSEVLDLHRAGHSVVLVHGGGKELTALLERLGISSRFHNGLRVTDAATRDAALMVYAGLVNKSIVASISRMGGRALGLAGDAGSVRVRQRSSELGYVGDVETVDGRFLDQLVAQRILPVLCSLGLGPDGQYYNINADSLAAAAAAALEVDRLVFLTDVPGVLDAAGQVLPRLSASDVERLIQTGVAAGGMRPKLESCLSAFAHGVPEIRIVGGHTRDAVRRAVTEGHEEGTQLYAA